METKFVYLSRRSLDKVYKWAIENEDRSKLADMYLCMCACCHDNTCSYGTKAYKIMDEAIGLAFISRDTIGRLILKIIKDQAK